MQLFASVIKRKKSAKKLKLLIEKYYDSAGETKEITVDKMVLYLLQGHLDI